jgi:hypothetical protein
MHSSSDGEHAILAPSSAERWGRCTGYLAMLEELPESEREQQDNEGAALGTAAHWYCAEELVGRRVATDSRAPNGVIIDAETAGAANVYVDHVRELMEHCDVSLVEERVSCDDIHELCWGTVDYGGYNRESRTIYVRDYKHGRKPVRAVGNYQLVCYALGVWQKLGRPTGVKFDTGIVQPRVYRDGGPIQLWQPAPNYYDLLPTIVQLQEAARAAVERAGRLRPGLHCYKCPALLRCPAICESIGAVEDWLDHATPQTTGKSPADVAVEWVILNRARKMLEYRLDAAGEAIKAYAGRGHSMPAVDVAPSRGAEGWALPDDQVVAVGQMYGVDLAKPQAAITPRQARFAGMPEEGMRDLTQRPPGALKITEASTDKARLIFAKGTA